MLNSVMNEKQDSCQKKSRLFKIYVYSWRYQKRERKIIYSIVFLSFTIFQLSRHRACLMNTAILQTHSHVFDHSTEISIFVKEYENLTHKFNSSILNELYSRLWFVTRKSDWNIDFLHLQKVKERTLSFILYEHVTKFMWSQCLSVC